MLCDCHCILHFLCVCSLGDHGGSVMKIMYCKISRQQLFEVNHYEKNLTQKSRILKFCFLNYLFKEYFTRLILERYFKHRGSTRHSTETSHFVFGSIFHISVMSSNTYKYTVGKYISWGDFSSYSPAKS